jgi:hypothetical protein
MTLCGVSLALGPREEPLIHQKMWKNNKKAYHSKQQCDTCPKNSGKQLSKALKRKKHINIRSW